MSIKEKPPDDFFKGIKLSLKSVLKHPDINTPKITNAVILCNKIVINVLLFMKLYLLNYYETHNTLPVIDKVFVNSCMKIMCNEKPQGRPAKKEIKELKDNLTAFYKTDFEPLIQKKTLEYTHMNTILDYLTIDILTMYENNIKNHFVEYVERYVNVVWKKKFIVSRIRKLNITQKELEYESGSFYYDIEYNFKFIPSDQCTTKENIEHKKLAHPFAPFSSDDDTKYEGVIVYANELTKKLVEFLLMDYEELVKIIDHTTTQRYKSNIMESLALLWD